MYPGCARREISDSEQLSQLLRLQHEILESLAKGGEQRRVLDDLCRMIESMIPSALASIMLLDTESGALEVAAGPSFPREALPYFKGLQPKPENGSCGNAALSGEATYVTDVPNDPRWDGLRAAAEAFSIGSCWSLPFFSEVGETLGTFAITSIYRGAPTPFQRRMLEAASHLAGITVRMQQREAKLQQLGTVFRDASEGMMITDAKGAIIEVNQSFTRITGYRREEILGKNPRLLNSGRQDANFFRQMWVCLEQTGRWQGEIWNRRKSGDIYPEWLSISRIDNSDGEPFNFVAVFSDISSLKESERKLYHLAHHDPLTGLPNRLLMTARLEHALKQGGRSSRHLALMFIDLDRFKNVNDSYGHALGDQLLISVAQRLQQRLRRSDTIARVGGDEFVVILEQLEHAEQAATMAQHCIDVLARPFSLVGHELYVTPSIGIAIYPQDGEDAESLLKNADIAMYRAKEEGRHRYSFFTAALSLKVQQRLRSETRLRRALHNQEFELYYQPVVSARTGGIVGAEALLRWNTPDRKTELPGSFLPVLEETGLIREVGSWVLQSACREMQRWEALGLPPIRLSVNVSTKQVTDSARGRQLQAILAESGLAAHRIELEITEHGIMQEGAGSQTLLHRLRTLGVSLAIDDFGSGHSSLARLKHLPVHCLKIEQSLVQGVAHDSSDQAICRAVVALGKCFGIRVVAEGVEQPEQAQFLKSIECDELQGFLFGQPMPVAEFRQFLADSRTES